MKLALLVLLAAAGCGDKKPEKCRKVAAMMTAYTKADNRTKSLPAARLKETDASLDKQEAEYAAQCEAHMSESKIDCILEAKSGDDPSSCFGH